MWHTQSMMPGVPQQMHGAGFIYPNFYPQQHQQIETYLGEITAWRETCVQKDIEMKSLKVKLLAVNDRNEGLNHKTAQRNQLGGSGSVLLQNAEERISELEAALKTEREGYEKTKALEFKRNRTLVLTKVKDSLCQISLLKKKLSREERENKESRSLLIDMEDKLVDANNRKYNIKKKLFRATKETEELKKQQEILEKSNVMKTIELQKCSKELAYTKNKLAQMDEKQTVLEANVNQLKIENQILRLAKADVESIHATVLAEKDEKLAQLNTEHNNRLEIMEENMNKLKVENSLLRLTKSDAKGVHDTEIDRMKEEMARLKKDQKVQESIRMDEIDRVKKLNSTSREEVTEKERDHQELLSKKGAEVKGLQCKLDQMNEEKLNHEKEDTKRKNETEGVMKLNAKLKLEVTQAASRHEEELGKMSADMKELEQQFAELNHDKMNYNKKMEDEFNQLKHTLTESKEENLTLEKKMKEESRKISNLENRLNSREVEIRGRSEEISTMSKKAASDQKEISKLRVSLENHQSKLTSEKKRNDLLIRQRNCYRDEVHTKSLEVTRISKKLDATKAYLQKVKADGANQKMNSMTATAPSKKKRRRKSNKQAATQNSIETTQAKSLEIVITKNDTALTSNKKDGQVQQNTDLRNMTMNNEAKKPLQESRRKRKPEVSRTKKCELGIETERSWSFYDTSLMAFCFTLWFAMANICTCVSNDDPFW
ncbi:CAP-Gly domain-containing linker protein 1-like [Clytia hemisphaerica]